MEKLFNLVFDEQNNIKPCGRQTTIKLMEELSRIYPDENFGNIKTGFMNIETVLKYKRDSI